MEDLGVDEGYADCVIADDGAKPSPVFGQLHQQSLDHVVRGDEGLFPRSVDDVGRPDEGHPVLGHRRTLVHHLHDLLLALHHDTLYRTSLLIYNPTIPS